MESPVYASGSHRCAVLADGSVSCWGSNIVGQLGIGTTTESSVPVIGIASATAISAGTFHSCALLSNETVRCWGFNDSGQLGNGSASGPETCGAEGQGVACGTTPVAVAGINTARAISPAVGTPVRCSLPGR